MEIYKLIHQKLFSIFIIIIVFSCSKDEDSVGNIKPVETNFISAVDISSYPEISETNPIFYDCNGNPVDFLDILKNNGVNTIRLRLWVNPSTNHSSLNEVKQFSETLKARGFKTWITVHFSDTWADPGQQIIPVAWQSLSITELHTTVYIYTEQVANELKPDYIQIGNEINSGLLHPFGNISTNINQFKTLTSTAIEAVRTHSNQTQIMLHVAGIENADWFFNQVSDLDYDIIGLSYYPIWHGKSLTNLRNTMTRLSTQHNKHIVIAETAYPFTLEYNDFTNNIVGLENQLILPEFPASPQGQEQFIYAIKNLVLDTEKGLGFCYWGTELIAWKGPESTNGSPWENQALFNFNNEALPVIKAFQID